MLRTWLTVLLTGVTLSAFPAEADKERKQEPGLFRNAWSFERKYETRSVADGRYVSIVRADHKYTSGAHPNSSSDTILWDWPQ